MPFPLNFLCGNAVPAPFPCVPAPLHHCASTPQFLYVVNIFHLVYVYRLLFLYIDSPSMNVTIVVLRNTAVKTAMQIRYSVYIVIQAELRTSRNSVEV